MGGRVGMDVAAEGFLTGCFVVTAEPQPALPVELDAVQDELWHIKSSTDALALPFQLLHQPMLVLLRAQYSVPPAPLLLLPDLLILLLAFSMLGAWRFRLFLLSGLSGLSGLPGLFGLLLLTGLLVPVLSVVPRPKGAILDLELLPLRSQLRPLRTGLPRRPTANAPAEHSLKPVDLPPQPPVLLDKFLLPPPGTALAFQGQLLQQALLPAPESLLQLPDPL
jgi:hypothetical protein